MIWMPDARRFSGIYWAVFVWCLWLWLLWLGFLGATKHVNNNFAVSYVNAGPGQCPYFLVYSINSERTIQHQMILLESWPNLDIPQTFLLVGQHILSFLSWIWPAQSYLIGPTILQSSGNVLDRVRNKHISNAQVCLLWHCTVGSFQPVAGLGCRSFAVKASNQTSARSHTKAWLKHQKRKS